MSCPRVVLINPGFTKECGVYQHGLRFFHQLYSANADSAQPLDLLYREVTTEEQYENLLNQPSDLYIVNYYSKENMPYVNPAYHQDKNVVGIMHEFSGPYSITDTTFKKYIVSDQSMSSRVDTAFNGNKLFNFNRPFPKYTEQANTSTAFTIGTFGYYFPNKGFEKLLREVLITFSFAPHLRQLTRVNMHITKPVYSGYDWDYFNKATVSLRAIALAFNIDLQLTILPLSDNALIQRLALNHVNVFLYDDNHGRGISSAIDFAVAANRPIIVSNSTQFRHLPYLGLFNTRALGSADTFYSKLNSLYNLSSIKSFDSVPQPLSLLPQYSDFYKRTAIENLGLLWRVINEE